MKEVNFSKFSENLKTVFCNMPHKSNQSGMRAVALSGGGDKGAFSVGVIKRLHNKGERFDIISGTSTGALIAPLLATGEIDELWNIYKNAKKSDIYKEYDLATAVLTKNSLFDVTPLENLIKRTITNDRYNRIMLSGKKIFISTVCLQNQRSTYFTNVNMPGTKNYDIIKWKDREQFIKAILASSVQPVLMPPVLMNRLQYVDGGVRNFLPSDITIDAGATDITAILTNPADERVFDVNILTNVKDILLRTIDVFSNEVGTNDLKMTDLFTKGASYIDELKDKVQVSTGISSQQIETIFTSANNPFFGKKKIGLRIIRPNKNLGDGLSFNNMEGMLALGYDTPDSMTVFYT